MQPNAQPMPDTVVARPSPKRLGRFPNRPAVPRLRFRVLPFINASGTRSYRVQGMNRDGEYLRQNYADLKLAQMKQAELEAEYHHRRPSHGRRRIHPAERRRTIQARNKSAETLK